MAAASLIVAAGVTWPCCCSPTPACLHPLCSIGPLHLLVSYCSAPVSPLCRALCVMSSWLPLCSCILSQLPSSMAPTCAELNEHHPLHENQAGLQVFSISVLSPNTQSWYVYCTTWMPREGMDSGSAVISSWLPFLPVPPTTFPSPFPAFMPGLHGLVCVKLTAMYDSSEKCLNTLKQPSPVVVWTDIVTLAI